VSVNRAVQALRHRRFAEAEALLAAHLEAHPGDADAARLLAAAAAGAGDCARAEQLLRSVIQRAPGFALAHADLASLLCREDRAEEALALLDEAAATDPRAVWPLSLKAGILTVERRISETPPLHEQAVARAPGEHVLWMNYGHALQAIGKIEEAATAYRRAVGLDPTNGPAWWGLANLRTGQLTPADIECLYQASSRASSTSDRAQIHFTLGRALGEQGAFERSFHEYQQANALRAAVAPYDGSSLSRLPERLRASLDRGFFNRRSDKGCDRVAPIFIIGMPRSGTTLVEQILASHPMVEGLGELFELGKIADQLGGSDEAGAWVEPAAALDADGLADLGRRYLALTRRYRRSDRPFFTDKMPANWQLVSLVAMILPNARIIDVRRDPIACCFSNFTTYFGRATRVPTDLRGWGLYYRDYVHTMDMHEGWLPGLVYRLDYEQLVDDPEGEIRRLLAHLHLPFDEGCLRFHETKRVVDTPSAQQVRKPLNREGLDRWRHYAPWLDPLKEELTAGSIPLGTNPSG
jgi:tetratricopeptide (TPR) repeat protein